MPQQGGGMDTLVLHIPKSVTERLSKEVGTYKRLLKRAEIRHRSHTATMALVTAMLSDVFGFDKHSEVKSDLGQSDDSYDLAVLLKDRIVYVLKVLAAGIPLEEKYLKKATRFTLKEDIPWVVLTNGVDWQAYKVRANQRITCELVNSFNFLSLTTRKKEDRGRLFALTREGVAEDAMDLVHEKSKWVNRFVIAHILTSEVVVPVVWKALRRMSPEMDVGIHEVEDIIRTEIINKSISESNRALLARSKVLKSLRS